ncbi:MAG: hypothetical protein IPJ07_12665 [Acidobacteria bacterium]|nr:hypothetical protein [Acidobacteriota bacterium]
MFLLDERDRRKLQVQPMRTSLKGSVRILWRSRVPWVRQRYVGFVSPGTLVLEQPPAKLLEPVGPIQARKKHSVAKKALWQTKVKGDWPKLPLGYSVED